ncbi:SGNH/GDSL hydrolase family protein [Fictibacillus phosphorivorans]|uniref:SGNH/GDSL hydrolase family protein n=1 Tax=Fictibacillus phosphorivorans TaxID=1221500 RepID=UPI003CE6B20A
MKKVMYSLIIALSIASIIFGNYYYKFKINETAEAAKMELSKTKSVSNESSSIKEITKKEEINVTKNLPDSIVSKIQAKQNQQKPVEFVILGSEVNALQEGTWTSLFQKELTNDYGSDAFNLTVITTKETSDIVLEDQLYKEALTLKPDLVLIEPFLLNDNGNYVMEDTLIYVEKIINDFEELESKPVIMLQPTNPIYQPKYYAEQVSMLKDYADNKGFIYLDHWTNWPDVNSNELNNYIESNKPNQKGYMLWAEFFKNYFIAE